MVGTLTVPVPFHAPGTFLAVRSDAGGPAGGSMRTGFQRVVPRPQAGAPASGRRGDQPVGEPGVLGQQGAVDVGPDHPAPLDALPAVAPVVAVAAQDPAERALGGPERRAAAVVLEAGEHLGGVHAVELDLDGDVAD